MGITVLMMMYAGILYGIPRRTAAIVQNIPGTDFNFAAASPLFAIFGVFGLLAITAGALFVVIAVVSLLAGDRVTRPEQVADLVAGNARPDGGEPGGEEDEKPVHAYDMRGTFLIVLLFMAVFVASYVLNWYLLTELWAVGA
jgi:cytochrome c oxidase subunit 1